MVDLDKLLIQLRPQVSDKWFEFGQAAGIEKKVLDNYAKNCSPGDCIMEMLDYWLRNRSAGQPTWREVATVLRAIGLGQLAVDIESVHVHSTGKLSTCKITIKHYRYCEAIIRTVGLGGKGVSNFAITALCM